MGKSRDAPEQRKTAAELLKSLRFGREAKKGRGGGVEKGEEVVLETGRGWGMEGVQPYTAITGFLKL